MGWCLQRPTDGAFGSMVRQSVRCRASLAFMLDDMNVHTASCALQPTFYDGGQRATGRNARAIGTRPVLLDAPRPWPRAVE